jgi:hypothetical protein
MERIELRTKREKVGEEKERMLYLMEELGEYKRESVR